MDLLLDMDSGDLLFANGECLTTQDYVQAVQQRLFITLRTFTGEWYLNTDHGVPYFQSILGTKNSKEAIDLIFQQKILGERGVQAITEFSSSINANRIYTLNFKVTVAGQEVQVTNFEVGV